MTLIDKDALLEKLSTFHPDYTFNITSFRNFIKAQPEMEKKGKWYWNHNNGYYYCSECDAISPREDQDGNYMDCPNFCPNCGARMEEK